MRFLTPHVKSRITVLILFVVCEKRKLLARRRKEIKKKELEEAEETFEISIAPCHCLNSLTPAALY